MNNTNTNLISRKELESYIGIKAHNRFYKKALDTYIKNPNKPIWCFSSFFLGMFWFAYRKALMPTLILATATFTLNTLIPIPLSIFLDIILFFILGFFGTNIFLSTAEKEIKRIKSINSHLNEDNLLELIAKKGGTSNLYAFVLYCSFVALIFLLFKKVLSN